MIVASSLEELKTAWFSHMEQHEDIHEGVMDRIVANTSYGCRLCDKKFKSEGEMDEHIQRHKKESRARSGRRRDRTDHEEGEITSRSPSSSSRRRRVPNDVQREPEPAPVSGKVCCKYCSKSWLGEPEKAVLRQHREKHSEMITSTNDCFQRECQACQFIVSYGEVRAWQSHVKSHDNEKNIQ